MKPAAISFCLNLWVAVTLFGQSWYPVTGFNPPDLNDVAFASASVGIAVGQQGEVFRTVNGGGTWAFYDLGTTDILRTVYFADVNHGFIMGNAMYQTTNSGATWVPSAGPGLPMEGICFVDNQRGTIVGSNGRIFHTTNGGMNWTPQSSNTSNTLKSVWFTSESNGIIVGEAGLILQTTDGGSSWSRYLSGTLQDLNSIFFMNAAMGFICGGNGTILRSTDGGLTWVPSLVESTAVSFLKVKMIDPSNGFAFGNSNNFALPIDFFSTSDGGQTWKRKSYGRNRAVQFYGMAVIDPKHCVIVGSLGTVMRSADGGGTWQSQELLPDLDLLAVTAPFSGILSSSFVTASSYGITLQSATGTTWETNRFTSRTLRAIDGAGSSLSAHTSIMAGDAGTVIVCNVDQRIGSRTSAQLNSDLTLRGVSMVDRDTAYIAGDSGYVFKSTDRGRSWTQIYSGSPVQLNGISFADPRDGFIVGDGGWIRRSTDFGQSWTAAIRMTPARLSAISFASPNVGIIVGERGTILRTTNGGTSWLPRPSPVAADLHCIVFSNPGRALAAGDSGRIIGSNDGGFTWQLQPGPGKKTLRGIAFLNDTVAVAVGDQRTILRTTSGVTSVAERLPEDIPSAWRLEQNFPNPFNPGTVIRYSATPRDGQVSGVRNVKLVVYDLLGREVAVLVNERKAAGNYEVPFNGSGLASGVYYYRLTAGAFVQTRKMLIVR